MFEFFIKQHKLAQVLSIGILGLGILAMFNIQKTRFPDVSLEVLTIYVAYPNSSPVDVENDITIPIEDEIKTLDDIDFYESVSSEGFTHIVVQIDQDAKDVQQVKQNIRTAVSNGSANFPSDAKSPVIQEIKTNKEMLKLVLRGDLPYKELRDTLDDLAKKIETYDGVASVDKRGYLKDEIKINIDPKKLATYKLSIDNVTNQIRERNYRYTVGDDNQDVDNANIVVLAKFQNLDELGNLVIKSNFKGRQILLKDIAKIEKGLKEKKNIVRINGEEGLILFVDKKPNSDIIKTVKNIKNKLEEYKALSLPDNVSIDIVYDLSVEVDNRVSIVVKNGVIGFALLLIILGIFLNIKTAFWVAVGVSVSLLGTVVLLWVANETINLISLIAIILVLGIVVDDSIIVSESIVKAKNKFGNNISSVVIGIKKVIRPVLATILTSILVMSSMFLMSGTMGKFIYIIPVVVIFALLISLLEIVVILPAHIAHLKTSKDRAWFKKIEEMFLKMAKKFLRFRYLVFIVFLSFIVFSGFFTAKNIRFELFPPKGSNIILSEIETKIGSSVDKTLEVVEKVENTIQQIIGDELELLETNIDYSSSNLATIQIKLIPSDAKRTSILDILEKLKPAVKNIKGVEYAEFNIQTGGPPSSKSVDIKLLGNNEEQRKKAMDKLEDILLNTPGVTDVKRSDVSDNSRKEIVIDFEKLARLGISFSSVRNYLRSAFSGIEVTSVRENNEKVYYKVFIGNGEENLDIINDMKISNRNANLIPFSDFTTIKTIEGESDVTHYESYRSYNIVADVDEKKADPIKVVSNAIEKLDIKNNFPKVKLLEDGKSKETAKSMSDFLNAFLISILGVYLLLMVLFNSYTQPLIALSAVPFSIIGVVWAFFFHGYSLSFFAILGTLALIGVIVNDSLVMISHLNDLKKEDGNDSKNYIEWISRGSTDRLRAVILTSVTTLVGVLPLAYGIGGVDYFLQPIVLALGYGLLFGTLVTLILLPCLYLINLEFTDFIARMFKKISSKFSKNKVTV